MRKSFEKYIKENSVLKHKISRNQGGGGLYNLKYYVIGFIIGLFFVGTFSYANTHTAGGIGRLFEKLTSQDRLKEKNGELTKNYRLHGSNIKDGTVTEHELLSGAVTHKKLAPNAVRSTHIQPGEVKTNNIGGKQVTNDKLAPNSVDDSKIMNVHGSKVVPDTIGEREISDSFKARNSAKADNANYANSSFSSSYATTAGDARKLDGKTVVTNLRDTHSSIPTSKAVKDYIDILKNKITDLETKVTSLENKGSSGGKNCGIYKNGESYTTVVKEGMYSGALTITSTYLCVNGTITLVNRVGDDQSR